MKQLNKIYYPILLLSLVLISQQRSVAQVGHVLQHVGAVNTSTGGASTAQPFDINGALQWNVATISEFNTNELSVGTGIFFSDPSIFSSVSTPQGEFSGQTGDDRGISTLPSLAMVFGKKASRHTFGVSIFGVAGFGVTFPQSQSNPITLSQQNGGFGRIESDYRMLQAGFAYSLQITEKLSLGVKPAFNYASLLIEPNPLSRPDPQRGFPESDKAHTFGIGGDVGLFYVTEFGLKLGAAYKTPQFFRDFEMDNTFLDGSQAQEVDFNLDYPSIISAGIGYSTQLIDFAFDYRYITYAQTDGFQKQGWELQTTPDGTQVPTGAVRGFGWQNISVVSTGIEFKGFDKFPVRAGYTFSENPIKSELAFFSAPATAIINDAFQIGIGHQLTDHIGLNLAYHHGWSRNQTSGPLLNPTPDFAGGPWNADTNPRGIVPGSNVGFDMTTDMLVVSFNYTFKK